MIESVEELEATIVAIEKNHQEIVRLSDEFNRLPGWALIRMGRNLDKRVALLEANAPYWEKLHEGLAPGVEAKTA